MLEAWQYHPVGHPRRSDWSRLEGLQGSEFLRALQAIGREMEEDFSHDLSAQGQLEAEYECWYRDELKARLRARFGQQLPEIEVDVQQGGEVWLRLPDGLPIEVEDAVRAVQRELDSFQDWQKRQEAE